MAKGVRIDGPRVGALPGTARKLVVLLHGYGADGSDLLGLAHEFGTVLASAAFVAPHAPQACPANPAGRQWFALPWLDGSPRSEMLRSLASAEGVLGDFLDAETERYGLAGADVAIVGFSQGAMLSLRVGLARTDRLAGIIAYSGRFAAEDGLPIAVRSRPPVLLAHGELDDLIPVDSIHASRATLAAERVPVRWHVSKGIGHGIGPDGLEIGRSFLAEVLEGREAA